MAFRIGRAGRVFTTDGRSWRSGKPKKALLNLKGASRSYELLGLLFIRLWRWLWLAEAYARLARLDEGLSCLTEAAHIIETTDQRCDQAELHRVRGDLLNAAGDGAAAEQNYHLALSIARPQGARIFELRAATSLARLWRDQGKQAEAHDLLAPIYSWFSEGLDTLVLKEANALLDQLARRTSPPGA
jgi:tetratricopeptide (TPR) repeat protein